MERSYQQVRRAIRARKLLQDLCTSYELLCKWGDCANCAGYGLRILNSSNILVYGAGLYTFFDNYNTSCSAAGNGETCQLRIFSLEGTLSNIDMYNLNIVGATSMINRDGPSLAQWSQQARAFFCPRQARGQSWPLSYSLRVPDWRTLYPGWDKDYQIGYGDCPWYRYI
jgi:hypothetical protein